MKVALVMLLCLFSSSSSSPPPPNHHVVRTIKAPYKSKSSSHPPVTKTITHKKSSKKDKCTEPAFISTWLKNTTTTKIEDAQLCVNIAVVETEETTKQFCEQVTFTPCENVSTKECINVVRSVLEEKTEKICIDETNTLCNMVVDTKVEFVDKTVCNKVCTMDCTVSTVTICDDGTREVEDSNLIKECKDDFKEECHAGPEKCEVEFAEECTTTLPDPEPSYHQEPSYQESSYGVPSADYAPVHPSPSYLQPHQDSSPIEYYSVPLSSHEGSYRSKRSAPSSSYPSHSPSSYSPKKTCKKVPYSVCHATTECQQIPVQNCTDVIVETVKQVPTCQCREEAVQTCNPGEKEICTLVSEPKITQTPREVCTERPRTICEDRIVTIPTTKNEEICLDLSTTMCTPFTKEVCIDIPSLEAKKVQKEVCTKIPDSEVVSTAESHDKEVKTIIKEKKVYKKYGDKPKTSKSSPTKKSYPEESVENEAEPETH